MKNRIIKFRAFVETYNGKEMVNDWCFLNLKDNHFNAVDLTNERPDIGEVYAVMQFTGLHDKNGKEIYEGDIVGGYPHGNVLVKYNDEWACFESYSTELDFDSNGEPFEKEITSLFANDLKDCFNEWEVIGNVFENPELLSDKH